MWAYATSTGSSCGELAAGIRVLRDFSGRRSPIAGFNVGQFYEEGKGGVEKDLKKAKECFVKSVSLGIKDAQ